MHPISKPTYCGDENYFTKVWDGKLSIEVWYENWIPSFDHFKAFFDYKAFWPNLRVLDAHNNGWNKELVNNIISPK